MLFSPRLQTGIFGNNHVAQTMKAAFAWARVLSVACILLAAVSCVSGQRKSASPALPPPLPLDRWQPEETKLMGEVPVSRADLPAEWQELTDEELAELLNDLSKKARILCFGYPKSGMNTDHEASLSLAQQMRYLALLLRNEDRNFDSLYEISDNLRKLWRIEDAIKYAEVAVTECEATSPAHMGRITEACKLLGWEYSAISQYDKALECFRKAYDASVACDDQVGKVNNLYAIGKVYLNLGMDSTAREYFNQTATMAHNDGNPPYEARALVSLGRLSLREQRNDVALDYFQRASATIKDEPPRYWDAKIDSLKGMGDVYLNLGDYERALDYYQHALAVAKQVDDLQAEAATLASIADLSAAAGRYVAAFNYFDDAVAAFSRAGDPSGQAECLLQRARVSGNIGLVGKAEQDARQAFDIFSRQVTQFSWESGLKGSLTENLYRAGSLLAQMQMLLGDSAGAFQSVQSCKGVPLLQLLAQSHYPITNTAVRAKLNEYRSTNAYLQVLQSELRRLTDDSEAAKSKLLERIEAYSRKADSAWSFIHERNPQLTEILEVKGLTPREVQRRVLRRGQVALEYLLTDHSVIIFALPKRGKVTASQIGLADMGDATTLSEWIQRQVAMLLDPREAMQRQAGQALYGLLIAPVEKAISQGNHLIICPDDALYSVPFDALVDPEGRLLLDTHSLSYSTSATMLAYESTGKSNRDALVAGITFTDEPPAQEGVNGNATSGETIKGASAAATLFSRSNLTPLPGVRAETLAVAEVLGVKRQLDATVTESWLRASLPGNRVIHLATHGQLSSIALLNGFYTYMSANHRDSLEPKAESGEDDGFLSMSEVMEIPMTGTELIVLSRTPPPLYAPPASSIHREMRTRIAAHQVIANLAPREGLEPPIPPAAGLTPAAARFTHRVSIAR
ncbi:MAG: hypothetical protein B1H03_05760 [Planctomycetales bacterium 4484_113]|nr:MAG: hypothetical protein B1H03_05760 [Planctomycetales bacterium 4484_113]